MTWLHLEHWRRMFGGNPWHFWGLSNSTVPVDSRCQDLTYQYAWQHADQAGRHEISQAITRAEALIAEYLREDLAPTYHEETVIYPHPGDHRLFRSSPVTPHGTWLPVQLRRGSVRVVGALTESTPVVAALTYSDEDGDGLNETATAIVTVPTGTQETEIVARFLLADCGPRIDRPEPPIRSVSLSGTTATITLDAWTLVRPIRYEGVNRAGLDPDTSGVLADAIEVFRRYISAGGTTTTDAQATLIWETTPPDGIWCDTAQSDPAGEYRAIARVALTDARRGLVAPVQAQQASGDWSVIDWSRCRAPDRVIVRYQSGRDATLTTDWQVVIARLAAAELSRPICACASANREIYEWQQDLSRTGAAGTDLFQAPADLTNPFGPRRGHLEAWRMVQRHARGIGIYAG